MSLFASPEEHAENPPNSWEVRKLVRSWMLATRDGVPLESFSRKRDAEAAKERGQAVTLYRLEERWYAGEHIPGWRPYAAVLASRQH